MGLLVGDVTVLLCAWSLIACKQAPAIGSNNTVAEPQRFRSWECHAALCNNNEDEGSGDLQPDTDLGGAGQRCDLGQGPLLEKGRS